MDAIGITRLVEDMIKEYQTSEGQCILFYSTNKPRDYKILSEKVEEFRKRLNLLLLDYGSDNAGKARDSAGEKDIQKELL